MRKDVFQKIFNESYDINTELDEEFNKVLLNTKNVEDLQKYCESKGITKIYRYDYLLQMLCYLYTLKDAKDRFEDYREYILNMYGNDIFLIEERYNEKYKVDELYIKTIDGELIVKKLSDYCKEAKDYFLTKNIDIETDDRINKCFSGSYDISTHLNENNEIVSGFIYGNTNKSKFLHVWVETKINQEDVVVDFPTNSIINKKGYYSIKHINEDEILQRISRKQMLEDFKKYDDTFNDIGISVPFYLTCRDEIIKDLEKNDKITRKK